MAGIIECVARVIKNQGIPERKIIIRWGVACLKVVEKELARSSWLLNKWLKVHRVFKIKAIKITLE